MNSSLWVQSLLSFHYCNLISILKVGNILNYSLRSMPRASIKYVNFSLKSVPLQQNVAQNHHIFTQGTDPESRCSELAREEKGFFLHPNPRLSFGENRRVGLGWGGGGGKCRRGSCLGWPELQGKMLLFSKGGRSVHAKGPKGPPK